MATITITAQQATYPIYHSAVLVVDSTLKANDDFRYVFKITVGAVTRKVRVAPRPGDGYGYLNLSPHLQNFIDIESPNIKSTSDFITGPHVDYEVNIDEEWTVAGVPNINVDVLTFSARVGFDTVLNRNDELAYTTPLYQLTDVNTRILWNVEEGHDIHRDDLFWLYMNNLTGSLIKLRVREVAASGFVITDNVTTFTPTQKANLARMDLSSYPLDAGTVKIAVQFLDNLNAPISEVKIMNIVEPCTKYTKHKFLYLGSYGSYSSINFDMKSFQNTSIGAKSYRKFIDSSSDTDVSRGITRFFVDSKTIHTANTDIVSDSHFRMLEDLFKSKRAFLDVRNDSNYPDVDFLPIEVISRNIENQKQENHTAPQYSMQWRFAFEEVYR